MKFLIPTAKEMQVREQGNYLDLTAKSQAILEVLAQASLAELERIYAIKPEAAKKEANRLRSLQERQVLSYSALTLFNGLMYRQIDRNLTDLDKKFTREHVFITSAFYGIINALDGIAEHRLDFNCKVMVDGQSLKITGGQLMMISFSQFLRTSPSSPFCLVNLNQFSHLN